MATRRKSSGGLLQALHETQNPVYALDVQRRIVFANAACGAWLRVPADQLIGLVCNYHGRTDAGYQARLAAALCPPPEALAGNTSRAVLAAIPTAPDSPEEIAPRAAHFFPLASEFGAAWVIGWVELQAVAEPACIRRDGQIPRPAELHQELIRWRREMASAHRLDHVLGASDVMRHIQRIVRAAIASGADAAIVGPRGSGLESLARAIHYSQCPAGAAAPLVPLDCALADPETLHAALRQTQSDRDRAAKGRLLLLHADQMNEALQHELSEFAAMQGFDVGVLSTGQTSLKILADRGSFPRGLAFHLSTLEIQLPPLRDRLTDLPILCQAIVEDFNAEGNRQLSGLHPETLELLGQYPWPGDIDELTRVIRGSCHAAREPLIQPADLPKLIPQGISAVRFARPAEAPIDLPAFLKEIENEIMQRALRAAKRNKTKAARLLGISRQRMIRWSEQHPID
jgi:DNA-binding NtrC family response regulator